MEAQNFENRFKKALEERTLQPSSKSWEQLRSKLDGQQKQSKTSYWWLGIAASFVGGVLLVSLLFNSASEIEEPALVEQSTPAETITPLPEETSIIETPVVEHIANAATEKSSRELRVTTTNGNILSEEKPISETENTAFNEQIDEAIAAVIAFEETLENATEAEVDLLLQQAAEKITREKQFVTPGGSVSAMALLEDVELELERSFRDKVFEILKAGYLKTKDAVANRND
jgi:cytoskeletal protein RodZ